jgi:hypothetical protein
VKSLGSSKEFAVNSSFDDWEIVSAPDWCTVTKNSPTQLNVVVAQNYTTNLRTGEIVIGKSGVYAKLKVTQENGVLYVIDVYRIVEDEYGFTAKSYDDVYLDGNQEATFGVDVYNIDDLNNPITPTPSWSYVNVSETFNNDEVVDSDNYITKTDYGFLFTNKFKGSGEAHGTVEIYLNDFPECSASTPIIYLTKYVLYVAPKDACSSLPSGLIYVDENLRYCDYESGTEFDFCYDINEKDFKIFTNVENGWTAEILFGPYLTVGATSLTYDCANEYQKIQIGSNIIWNITKEYVTLTSNIDDYTYIFKDNNVFEPTKAEKFAQMYEKNMFVDNGEYIYVQITKKRYDTREDVENEAQQQSIPVSNITIDDPIYILDIDRQY